MESTIKDEVIDNYLEHEFHDKYDSKCSTCYSEKKEEKFFCDICEDTGFREKIEWTADGQDYPITIKCGCQED